MLRNTHELIGYKLAATDGVFGKVKDFLFDEDQWTVRYMVADTGPWLIGNKVLVSPVSLGEPDWHSRTLTVRLTKEDIENAPGLDEDAPVSRDYEKRWFDTYKWSYYWGGTSVWGSGIMPGNLYARRPDPATVSQEPESGASVLRSISEVDGYKIRASDGGIGHVEDFIVDDETWSLRYLVVDTRNWLPGKKVLIAPKWIDAIAWVDQEVTVDLTREAVKNSPDYESARTVSREYEERLYDYYGFPGYW